MAGTRVTGRYPDFFILGAPRCGTTFLYSALRAQPAIFMPDLKKPHHFAADVDNGTAVEAHLRVRDQASYLALFAPAHADQLIGEASDRRGLDRLSRVYRCRAANPGSQSAGPPDRFAAGPD